MNPASTQQFIFWMKSIILQKNKNMQINGCVQYEFDF